MKTAIRKNDIWRVVPVIFVGVQKVPAQLVTAEPRYLTAVAAMPDWLFPLTLGFAIAVWAIDPWTEDSRLRQFWDWLTRKFIVEGICAQHWLEWRDGIMPESDIGVRARIRFTKDIRNGRVVLRVFSCTGLGRKPFEHVIPIKSGDFIKGQILDIPIVDIGIPEAGWDHQRKRGWGPDPKDTLISDAGNVVVIECQGLVTQAHKIFISTVSHVGKHSDPRIYIQDERDDIFNTSAETRIGKYAL